MVFRPARTVSPHELHDVYRFPGGGRTVVGVVGDLHLDWHAVKEMDKLYMREQLARVGPVRPAIIGVEEMSIRKGQKYVLLSHRANLTPDKQRAHHVTGGKQTPQHGSTREFSLIG